MAHAQKRKTLSRPFLEETVGRCWASQEIRQAIRDEQLIAPQFSEERIQPSSFEPTLGDEAFILDTDKAGIFTPQRDKSVYRSLLEVPLRARQRVDLLKDPVLHHGFTYLIPLRERFAFREAVSLRASPKSSIGRVFTHVRTLTDCMQTFDQAFIPADLNKTLESWALVQPLKFDILVAPGLSLHQLRIFSGYGARLDASALHREVQHTPFLFVRNEDGELLPANHEIRENGATLHLDLLGKGSSGIVALRARQNTTPIDLTQTGKHIPEDYFEPLKASQGTLSVQPGSYYLLASQECFAVPAHRNIELGVHADASVRGPRHFAGFIDNGFNGDLVLEFRSDEPTSATLRHGDPIGEIHVFRTHIPDKIYGGENLGSHYQTQQGPRTAKYFLPLDFAVAARNFLKLDRKVMTCDARSLRTRFPAVQGFSSLDDTRNATSFLEALAESALWSSRYDCESDELLRQPIPYLLLFGHEDGTILTYQRAASRINYGEQRLLNKRSLGVGGHVAPIDGPDFFNACLQRELHEELNVRGTIAQPHFTGVVLDDSDPVGRVHLGLVYVSRLASGAQVSPKEDSLLNVEITPFSSFTSDAASTYESWSTLLFPHLQALSRKV